MDSIMKGIVSKAKSLALGITEVELKVLEATNEEPWGPHGSVMTEIARAAENYDSYPLVMNIITQRLDARDENWRLCYKALLLLDFLVKQGPPRVVSDIKSSQRKFERLRDDFNYRDTKGVDQGVNVRARARDLVALINDPSRIQEERERAQKNAGKYTGVSSSEMRGGGGGYASSGTGAWAGGASNGRSGMVGFGGGGNSKGASSSYDSYSTVGPSGAASTSGRVSASGGRVSGSGGRVSGSGGRSSRKSDGGEEDPFEATRKRIDKLKQQDVAPLGPPQPAANIDPVLVDGPTPPRAPRKLKDTKINPAMAAAFASMTQAANVGNDSSAPSTARLAMLPPPPSSKTTALPPPPQAASASNAAAALPTPQPALDLLSLLDDFPPDPAPAAAVAAAPPAFLSPAAPAPVHAHSTFPIDDAIRPVPAFAAAAAAPVPAAPAVADEWDAFASRPGPASAAPPASSSLHTSNVASHLPGPDAGGSSIGGPPAAAAPPAAKLPLTTSRPELALFDFGEPFPVDSVAPRVPPVATHPPAPTVPQPQATAFPPMSPLYPPATTAADPFAALQSGGPSVQYGTSAGVGASGGFGSSSSGAVGTSVGMGGVMGGGPASNGMGLGMGGFVGATPPMAGGTGFSPATGMGGTGYPGGTLSFTAGGSTGFAGIGGTGVVQPLVPSGHSYTMAQHAGAPKPSLGPANTTAAATRAKDPFAGLGF